MSYRGFKRLLGESGLERKTRMLLGAGVILLMTASFYVYARQTEELATDQLLHSARAVVPQILARVHSREEIRAALTEYLDAAERTQAETWRGYSFRLMVPNPRRSEYQEQAEDREVLELMRANRIQDEKEVQNKAEK